MTGNVQKHVWADLADAPVTSDVYGSRYSQLPGRHMRTSHPTQSVRPPIVCQILSALTYDQLVNEHVG